MKFTLSIFRQREFILAVGAIKRNISFSGTVILNCEQDIFTGNATITLSPGFVNQLSADQLMGLKGITSKEPTILSFAYNSL